MCQKSMFSKFTQITLIVPRDMFKNFEHKSIRIAQSKAFDEIPHPVKIPVNTAMQEPKCLSQVLKRSYK